MILALDVGNTNLVIGCIENGDIVCEGRLSTDQKKTMEEYAIHFKILLEMNEIDPKTIEGAIISSVVPPLNQCLVDAVKKITNKTPILVSTGIETGLNINIDNPNLLGADLIVDAVAAIKEYEVPLVIFDLGTATTCSVIDENYNYIGGMIFPGVRVAANALSENASQLPHISLESPKNMIGRNTVDCMQSGILIGNAAMIDGVIDRIEEELGRKVTAIATGGLSKCIIEQCKRSIIYESNLLFKGLWILYLKNKE